jgi:hypothetical protein
MDIFANQALEGLNQTLNNDEALRAYKLPYDSYKTLLLPRILGSMLVSCGNIVYGSKPSYLKFRAVEVIARVPYHSWEHAAFTLLTLFYTDEKRALSLSKLSNYVRTAQDNETMHVIVISQLAHVHERAGFVRHTLIPLLFALFYFSATYVLYLIRPRWSYELNFLFESHAFAQYQEFIDTHETELKARPILSEFLSQYGRNPISQYDFFRSVRNDEIIHRNESIHHIDSESDARTRIRVYLAVALCVGVLIACL